MYLPQGPRQSLVEGVVSNPRPSFRLCPRPTSASPAPSVSQLGSPSPHGRQSCVCYRSLAPQGPHVGEVQRTRAGYQVPERLEGRPEGLVTAYPNPPSYVDLGCPSTGAGYIVPAHPLRQPGRDPAVRAPSPARAHHYSAGHRNPLT